MKLGYFHFQEREGGSFFNKYNFLFLISTLQVGSPRNWLDKCWSRPIYHNPQAIEGQSKRIGWMRGGAYDVVWYGMGRGGGKFEIYIRYKRWQLLINSFDENIYINYSYSMNVLIIIPLQNLRSITIYFSVGWMFERSVCFTWLLRKYVYACL